MKPITLENTDPLKISDVPGLFAWAKYPDGEPVDTGKTFDTALLGSNNPIKLKIYSEPPESLRFWMKNEVRRTIENLFNDNELNLLSPISGGPFFKSDIENLGIWKCSIDYQELIKLASLFRIKISNGKTKKNIKLYDESDESRKTLIKKQRNTNELMMLIYNIFDKYDVKVGIDDETKLPAVEAWGYIVSGKFEDDLIKTVNGIRKVATIELNGGDEIDFEQFKRTYKRRFK